MLKIINYLMKITISGTPGSGKTVIGKYLAKKLHFKYYGMGELMRDFAEHHKLNLIELGELLKKNKKLDKKFNEHIKKLNNKKNIIIDSRIGFLFIKKGIHLFLDADLNLRARRIFKDKRKLENFKTVDEVKKEITKRLSLERERFRKLYKVDFTNKKNYDIVIDTTGLNAKIVSKKVLDYLKKNDI